MKNKPKAPVREAEKDSRVPAKLRELYERICDHYISPDRLFAALLTGFMFSYIIQLICNNAFYDLQNYYNSINFGVFFVLAAVVVLILAILTYRKKARYVIPWALFSTALVLSVMYAMFNNESNVYFVVGIGIIDFIIIKWLVSDDKLGIGGIKFGYKPCLVTAIVLFLITGIAFGYITSLRYLGYADSTFDFGVFAQMFERMATTGLPETTVERTGLTSHFGVHFSPFFYLLLPFYMLFRNPVSLCYFQSFAIAGGVFAVYLIAKKLELSGKLTLALLFIYAFYPALFDGAFYDFHENKFLTVIILFLFYFIISDKMIPTVVFSLLLLSVKEDAAIYLIAIALFVMINRKKIIKGAVMLAMAVIYFLIAQAVVASMGTEGVMMWRLSDYFLGDEQSFTAVAKSIFFDLGFLVKQMFTADKFPFVLWMLLPVVFTPLMTRKVSSLILLLPIIPINLMQSWQYQYNIDYQYTYGVAALVIMSAIFVIAKLKGDRRRLAVMMSLFMCAVAFTNLVYGKTKNNFAYRDNTASQADEIEAALREIPEDATVTATHRLMPHLYFIKDITSANSSSTNLPMTEYYVVDNRYADDYEPVKTAMGSSYTLIKTAGFAEIYKINA